MDVTVCYTASMSGSGNALAVILLASSLPMFKAEKFDPDAWAKLFREAGAQYVVMTAKHGDEYAMWPSKFTHRNAKEVGPNRDLLGDLTKSVRAANMRMGFYHNTTYTF